MKKIDELLLKENKIFEILHTISLIFIFAIIIFISIEIYIKFQFGTEEENALNDIEIYEDPNQEKTESKTFESEKILINPGKGYVIRDSMDKTNDEQISVVYYRISWNSIEPQEGKYNWNLIDSKIEECISRNKKFAFGIMSANSSSSQEYVTPKWVFDSGAQYYTYNNSYKVKQKIPIWTDTIFLSKLENFINVLAKRYDGNPNIAFIDIRSYGNWGEEHLGTIGGTKISKEELQELYIKPYMNVFKKTLLVNPWGEDIYNDIYKWAIDNGISIRRDGILKYVNGKECFDYAYSKLPTIFEYYASYDKLKKEGYWNADLLIEYVEKWRPSYIEFDSKMYKENKEFCEMLANKIGYYFKFKGAEYKNKTTTKEETEIKLNFINEGVAPLYEPCTVYIGLLDKKYNLVKKYKTDIDPHKWVPNEEEQENIKLQLNGIEDGEYIISIGLFLNENDTNPTYLLGNTGGTDEKWYVFGKINITNPIEESNNTSNNNSESNSANKNNTENNNQENNSSENDNSSTNNSTENNEDNEFSIEEYLANNPVEINYSETEITNKNIVATIQTSAEIQITNNNWKKEHTFEENGTFTYEYTIKGQAFTKTAEVKNIDKENPQIIGIEDGKVYKNEIEINIVDQNLSEVKIILNEEQIEYTPNMKLTEDGFYTITATDKAGNEATISFEILAEQGEYKIKEKAILNITNNTNQLDFREKLNLKTQYEITRNEEKLKEDDIIATGDILKTTTGEEYTLIVAGDINRDGNVNIKDLIKMRKYLLERNNLNEIEKLAADCNLDGNDINIKDFIRMRIIALTKVYK